MAEQISFEIGGSIGVMDRFMRAEPADQEGSPEAWAFAKTVIDHGCFVLNTVNDVRGENSTKDMVAAALLRRALVTAEGTRSLLASGLEEPAFTTFRTLLEIEASLRLVVDDATGTMARRLAAYHHLKGQRHFTAQLRAPSLRAKIKAAPNHFEWTLETTRRLKGFLSSYDDIKDDLLASQHWHGLKNLKEFFEEAGLGEDYLSLYGLFSPFVHAGNLEHDFVGSDEHERPMMRALVERDPSRTLHTLFGVLLKLIEVLDVFLDHHGEPEYQDLWTVTPQDGEAFTIPVIDGLRLRVMQIFGEGPDLSAPTAGGST